MSVRGISVGVVVCISVLMAQWPTSVWVKQGAPPKSKVLLGALATSQKAVRKKPIELKLTHLKTSPPTSYELDSSVSCEDASWTLSSASGDSIKVGVDVEDRLLSTLAIWLCEPYPVKSLNERKAHLDPDIRTILSDDDGFSYRLGSKSSSYMLVDFELQDIERIVLKPSKKGSSYRLVAKQRADADGKLAIRVSLSQDGKLVWTANIKR